MRKKLIPVILCIVLFSVLSVQGAILKNNIDLEQDIAIKNQVTILNVNETHILVTNGPVNKFITEVTITNGSSPQVDKINKLLERRIFRFIIPLSFARVENISFTVEYKRDPIFDFSRFSFYTMFADVKNFSLEDPINSSFSNWTMIYTVHTINVEDFNGWFFFFGGKPLRFRPATFMFIGTYEKMTAIA